MAVITEICDAFTVENPKNRHVNIQNRPWYGMSLAMDGVIVYTHRGERFVSDADHVVILPKGQSYELTCTKGGRFTLINFQLDVDDHPDTFRVIPLKHPSDFLSLHKQMEMLVTKHDDSARFRAIACLYEMAALLTDAHANENLPPLLRHAVKLANENVGNAAFGNTALAKELHISEVYLRKLFSTHLNTSPKQYLQALRLAAAQARLTKSSDSVTAIAEECGYASPSAFSRAFKRQTGVSPEEFRKTHQMDIM